MLERMNPRNTMMTFILTPMRKKCSQEVGGGDFKPVKLNVSFMVDVPVFMVAPEIVV